MPELFSKYDTETGQEILSKILKQDIEQFLRDEVRVFVLSVANERLDDEDVKYQIVTTNSSAYKLTLSNTCHSGKVFVIKNISASNNLLIYKESTFFTAISAGKAKIIIRKNSDWEIIDIPQIPTANENEIWFADMYGLLTTSSKFKYENNRKLLLEDAGTPNAVNEFQMGNAVDKILLKTVKDNQSLMQILGNKSQLQITGTYGATNYNLLQLSIAGIIFGVNRDGKVYAKGLTIDDASKGVGKLLASDADGNSTWDAMLASESKQGLVEIATQTEFDADTDQNGSNYLLAPVSMIRRAIPPQKHVLVGSDVLLDETDLDYAICTLNIPSASWKYEIEFTLYTEFSATTAEMQFFLQRSNTSNLAECKGIITQIYHDTTSHPTNSVFWSGSTGDWAGVDLLNLQTMQCPPMSDRLQVITLKAFIQPTNALTLTCYVRKNNGGQCKIKKRSYATAKAFN